MIPNKRTRIFKGHNWIKLSSYKSECTRCKLIRILEKPRYEYYKDNIHLELLPDCK